jgi:hypothetical protein
LSSTYYLGHLSTIVALTAFHCDTRSVRGVFPIQISHTAHSTTAKMASAGAAAASLLKRQLKEMQSGKDLPGISCGLANDNNIFEWEVMLMINDDCKYYGGTWLFFPSSLSLALKHTISIPAG